MDKIFLILLTVLFVSGCKSTRKTQTTEGLKTIVQQHQLVKENKWVLESFNEQSPKEAGFIKRLPFVIIDKTTNQINGFTGCNSFFGPVEVEGAKLKTGLMMSTKALCLGVPEPKFFNNLKEASSFTIEGDRLFLLNDTTELMVFKLAQKE